MYRLAAAAVLLGTAAHSSFAAAISYEFVGITTQVAGSAPGIFDVRRNTPVYGTVAFNPSAFSPDPVVPSGPWYLDVFLGGAGSVNLSLQDAGGSADIVAQSAFLELSSSSGSPWALVVTGQDLSFSMILHLQPPGSLPPGTSAFDGSRLEQTRTSFLISDPKASLGWSVDPVAAVPEPSSGVLAAGGLAGLLLCFYRAGRSKVRRG